MELTNPLDEKNETFCSEYIRMEKRLILFLSASLNCHRRALKDFPAPGRKLMLEDLFHYEPLTALLKALDTAGHFCSLASVEHAVDAQLERLSAAGIRFLTPEDRLWPERLSHMPDPPRWLYFRGTLPEAALPAVAVIGSRNATNYGKRMAEFISGELAKKGVGIVSGLADGIDGAAQCAALQAGGRSYGVLGCGVNICYPRENYELFTALCGGQCGGVISEFPPDSPSKAWHFPDRNRIISALGDVLAVIEARGFRSGSMITVGYALDQGKEVFAVPGRITDPMSRGCNALIQSGATILSGPNDILDYIGLQRSRRLPPKKHSSAGLSPEEKRIFHMLGEEPCFLENIIQKTGLPAGSVMSTLLKLELEGFIEQPSGNFYCARFHP
ncbi:DNA processing protein [Moryella indoligenes]|uniref:DNA processing protein n=1 Tax=Moryella indoligenes TaxID=371674 RepID=A0AAE3VBJ6_9FIRM|nr:DNA-processing protein DprA [Moryella indoligenes]MDQ0153299.1 DNA processing protein [Moryella indoligenes]